MFLPLTLVTQEHLIPRTCSRVCTSKVDTFDMATDFSFASAISCTKRYEVPTATNANTSSFFSFKVPGSHFKKLQILTPGSTGSYITVSVRVQPFFCGGSCSFCQFANTAASRKLLSRAFYLRSSSLRMGNYFSGSASNDASASNDVQPPLSSYTFERLDKSEPNLSFTELHGSVIFGVRRMG